MDRKIANVCINGKVYVISDDINKNLKLLNSLYKSIEEIFKDFNNTDVFNEAGISNLDEMIRQVDLIESGIIMFENYCETIKQQVEDKIFKKKYYKTEALYYWYKWHSNGIILKTWKFLATARKGIIEEKEKNEHETKV